MWGGVSWAFELDDLPSAMEGLSAMLADNIAQALEQLPANP